MIDKILWAVSFIAVGVTVYLLYLSAYALTEWIYNRRERRGK